MNEKISANEFRESIDRYLSGMKADPWLAQRIISSERGEVKVKKISGAMLVVTLMIVLTMATALAADITGVWRNHINWFGEEVQEEADNGPLPTPSPSVPVETAPTDIDHLVQESMNSAAPRELVVIATGNGAIHMARKQDVSNMEEFAALMETVPDFPLPQSIPEGYIFSKGSIEFGCLSDGEYILTSRKTIAEGVTESRYIVDESHDCVLGYILRFTGEDGKDDIIISAHMQPSCDPGDSHIGVWDDQTAQVIQVDGMDNSVAVESDTIHFLFMRKVMTEPVSTLVYGPVENWIESYGEYHIKVSSQRVKANDLIGVFAK